MNSEYFNGTHKLTDSATVEDIEKELADPEVKRVMLHKPGDVVKLGGKAYKVGPRGNWMLLDAKS